MRFRLFLALGLWAAAARASSVSDELSVYNTAAGPQTPQSGNVSDSLRAAVDLSDQWSVNASATVTAQGQTPAAAKGEFGTTGNLVSLFSLGADFAPSDNWTVGASFDFSPQSTQYAGTQVLLTEFTSTRPVRACTFPNPDPGCQVDNALLRSQASELAGAANVSYDTAGDSDLEWAFDADFTFTHLDTLQKIAELRGPGGALASPLQIRDFCRVSPKKCPHALLNVLGEQDAPLDFERLSLSATATAWRDTDFTLSGDYYVYDEDPATVGYFTAIFPGRSSEAGGNGVAIAPVQWDVRADAAQKFGDFSVKLWLQAGEYAAGTGQSTTALGLKLQYKITKHFKVWASLTGQKDVGEPDSTGVAQTTNSSVVSMGAGYRF